MVKTSAVVTISRELGRSMQSIPRYATMCAMHVDGYGVCEGFQTSDGYFIACSMVAMFDGGTVYRYPLDQRIAALARRCRPVEPADTWYEFDDPFNIEIGLAMCNIEAEYEWLCKNYK